MSSFTKLWSSETGIDVAGSFDQENGWTFRFSQDLTNFLSENKDMYNTNDGYSKSRELRRVARIPVMIQQKWLNEEGWDCYDLPANWDKLKAKLNSSEWLYLRTAGGRL